MNAQPTQRRRKVYVTIAILLSVLGIAAVNFVIWFEREEFAYPKEAKNRPDFASESREGFEWDVRELWSQKRWKELNDKGEQLYKTRERFPDGQYKFHEFLDVFSRVTARMERFPAEKFASYLATKLSLAPLVVASAHIGFGWDRRGSGYGVTVTKAGWSILKEHCQEAHTLLKKAEADGLRNPELYLMLMQTRVGSGEYTQLELDEIFQKGLAADADYFPLYGVRLYFASPKWGGDRARVAPFLDDAVRRTEKVAGQEYYATLATKLSVNPGEDYVQRYGLSWERVRQGMYDYQKRVPGVLAQDVHFLAMACNQSDKELAAQLMSGISSPPKFDGGSVFTEATWASCRALASGANAPAVLSEVRRMIVNHDAAGIAQLLETGAPINQVDSDGGTPLIEAIDQDDDELALQLLAKGADPNLGDRHGMGPLQLAAHKTNFIETDFLLARGADINALSTSGHSALHYAVQSQEPEIVTRLLREPTLVPDKAGHGKGSPFFWAVNDKPNEGSSQSRQAARLEIIQALLADPRVDPISVRGPRGWTPLMAAAYYGEDSIIKLLLQRGADPRETSELGWTAIKLAHHWGHKSSVSLLMNGRRGFIFKVFAAIAKPFRLY